MRIYRPLLLLWPALLMAACSQQDVAGPAAGAAKTTEAKPATQPETATRAAESARATASGIATMAGGMQAMAELCGVSDAGSKQQTLETVRTQVAAQGLSSSETERLFTEGYDAAKIKAASNPAKMQADCELLQQLPSAEDMKQLQQATQELPVPVESDGV